MKKIIILLLMLSFFALSCDKGDKPRITEENLKNIEKKQQEKQLQPQTEKTTENK